MNTTLRATKAAITRGLFVEDLGNNFSLPQFLVASTPGMNQREESLSSSRVLARPPQGNVRGCSAKKNDINEENV